MTNLVFFPIETQCISEVSEFAQQLQKRQIYSILPDLMRMRIDKRSWFVYFGGSAQEMEERMKYLINKHSLNSLQVTNLKEILYFDQMITHERSKQAKQVRFSTF